MSAIRDRWLAYGREQVKQGRPESAAHWSALDRIPRTELRQHQAERVSLAYQYLWEKSPFYRAKFEAAGLGPDSVRTLEDLLRVPVTQRDEWLDDQRVHPPYGTFSPLSQEDWLERGWMLFATSGTTAAMPRMFRHTTHDRDMWAWLGARALHAMGVGRGDITLNCFGYGTSVAFWGLHYACNLMGIPVIPGGGSNTERRVAFIRDLKPTVLMCTPSYALHLGRTARELGVDPATSSIRTLVVAGEPGASIMATKARIEELWGATVHDDFGCTEVAMSPLGYTCAYQASRKDRVDPHLMEDAYFVEALDPKTWRPVERGQRGVLVVSNLFSESQPILRYVMGDWIEMTDEPCPCGRTHARAVGGLHGRNDQMMKIRGLQFFPSALEDAIRAQQEIGDEYRVEITRKQDLDAVTVSIEPGDPSANPEQLERDVAARLKGALGLAINVVCLPSGTLPRTEFKAKRLFDLR